MWTLGDGWRRGSSWREWLCSGSERVCANGATQPDAVCGGAAPPQEAVGEAEEAVRRDTVDAGET